MGVGGQCHVAAALPPGKTRYPLYTGLDGPQGRSGWAQKISPSVAVPGEKKNLCARVYVRVRL
jgi:hypothetical protein